MYTVKYIGCFFAPEEVKKCLTDLERNVLDREISAPHVTFSYEPKSVPWEFFGEEVTVKAVGYGNDGENEALQVEFIKLPAGLNELTSEIAVPHITLSVSKRGRSVNSRWLEFKPITPFAMTGIFGAMDDEGAIHV